MARNMWHGFQTGRARNLHALGNEKRTTIYYSACFLEDKTHDKFRRTQENQSILSMSWQIDGSSSCNQTWQLKTVCSWGFVAGKIWGNHWIEWVIRYIVIWVIWYVYSIAMFDYQRVPEGTHCMTSLGELRLWLWQQHRLRIPTFEALG